MDLKRFLERLRQIHAVDWNALEIYSDLAKRVQDPELANAFRSLAQDEAKHVRLENELMLFAVLGLDEKR
jgi:rubrerythrin